MTLLWIAVAAVSLIMEMFFTTLLVIPWAIGAAAALGAMALGGSEVVQVLALVAGTSVGYMACYPLSKRLAASQKDTITNTKALTGQKAMTLTAVDQHAGQIKLQGEVWSARSWDEDEKILEGHQVEVVSIKGATAIIRAIDVDSLDRLLPEQV